MIRAERLSVTAGADSLLSSDEVIRHCCLHAVQHWIAADFAPDGGIALTEALREPGEVILADAVVSPVMAIVGDSPESASEFDHGAWCHRVGTGRILRGEQETWCVRRPLADSGEWPAISWPPADTPVPRRPHR